MEEEMFSQNDGKSRVKYDSETVEPMPEFIVCANDDNFEIAFDPFATIDDDCVIDKCDQPTELSPIDVERDVKEVKKEKEEKALVSLKLSPPESDDDDFHWDDGGVDSISPTNVKREAKCEKEEKAVVPSQVTSFESEDDDFHWDDGGVDGFDDNLPPVIVATVSDSRVKCPECDESFQNKSQLKNHSKKHAASSTNTTFACVICGKHFRRPNNLKLHMDATHPINDNGEIQSQPQPKQCKVCQKEFTHNGNFKTHMKIHEGNRKFQCTLCEKAFVLAQHLKSHTKLVHSDEKSIQCTICGKLFNHPGNYKKHMRTHTGERPFKCSLCSKSFGQSSNYTAHMRVHTNPKAPRPPAKEKPFKCGGCDKSFMRPSHLHMHARKHEQPVPDGTPASTQLTPNGTGKHRLCTICGKSLAGGRRSLRMHMKIHENNRPHACQYCDKKFITRNDCAKHMRIHTGEKPYQCELCTKRFRHLASYRIHMRNHNGEKPYRCSHCDKGFSASSDCKKHMKSHENGRLATPSTTVVRSLAEAGKSEILYI